FVAPSIAIGAPTLRRRLRLPAFGLRWQGRQVLRLIDNHIGFALTFPTERSELTTEGRKPLRFGYSRERISIALIYNQ
ncbi:MAG: hypothetical protein KDC34_10175, partial [Saprospiraceae bacterium]|nr:hypothetical protein [Saprospiraceae bacterium]